jgi:hypothetical protein
MAISKSLNHAQSRLSGKPAPQIPQTPERSQGRASALVALTNCYGENVENGRALVDIFTNEPEQLAENKRALEILMTNEPKNKASDLAKSLI